MALSQKNNSNSHAAPVAVLLLFSAVLSFPGGVAAQDEVPEIEVIPVTPQSRNVLELVPDWDIPRTPSQLTGQERQALLQQISGGGSGGTPLLNNIQTMGRTPVVRQLILSVKRPWYVHRAFLSSEGAERVDVRSVMRFGDSQPGRAIVGVNLIAGSTYLFDFLVSGEGEGTFTLETDSGLYEFPDPNGDRDNVLVAFRAEQSGWTEISLRRTSGSFDLHSVEVTLAVARQDQESGTK